MLVHNGVHLDGENVLNKDIAATIPQYDPSVNGAGAGGLDGGDWPAAQIEARAVGTGVSVSSRVDMRIRAGAECICSQTRGQKNER